MGLGRVFQGKGIERERKANIGISGSQAVKVQAETNGSKKCGEVNYILSWNL